MWLVLLVLALLIALAARVDACPDCTEDADASEEGARSTTPDDDADDLGNAGSRTRVQIDIETSATRATPGRPALADVIAAAVRAAGLAGDPAPSWRWRSRLAGLVPMVSVRGGRNDSWNEIDDPTVHRLAAFDVRATWRLDRLVFDPNEPRIAAIDVARRRERRRVAEEAITAYHAWLRAVGSGNAPRLEEAVARLDVLTDGWFSEAVVRP